MSTTATATGDPIPCPWCRVIGPCSCHTYTSSTVIVTSGMMLPNNNTDRFYPNANSTFSYSTFGFTPPICAVCEKDLEVGEKTICGECKKAIKAMKAIMIAEDE